MGTESTMLVGRLEGKRSAWGEQASRKEVEEMGLIQAKRRYDEGTEARGG